MVTEKFEPPDLQKFIASLGLNADPLKAPWRRPEPELLPVPAVVRGFRIRVDLQGTKPPVWRRIEVPGDILLPRLHEVIQAAMGWSDTHLHRFRTNHDLNAPEFLTQFDLDEGEEGMLENDVRLDQILSAKGDRLWYEYDFGDGWRHVLRVEKVLHSPPSTPVCLTGRLACPPEDCGGVWGYSELAAWVRSDYDDDLRPDVFDSTEEALAWLPNGWHPDMFDVDETNEAIAAISAEPIPVVEGLGTLLMMTDIRGAQGLRDLLAHPAVSGTTEVSAEEAAELTESFRVLLDVIGDGMPLTAAGYLKPAAVEQIAQRTGVTEWWIGKANREDLTWPVAELRATARALGLISVRKGRIAPTRAITEHRDDPQAILRHITGRLPLGNSPVEEQAGWLALAVVACETPAQLWEQSISELLVGLGWQNRDDPFRAPSPESLTLDALRLLAGTMRTGRSLQGVNTALAASARAVIRA